MIGKSMVLSFVNKKGGVGKTTISSNLSQCLALIGKKVLVIDNDEQHNMSLSLGIKKLPAVTLADLYEKPGLLPNAIMTTFIDDLDCICGSDKLSVSKPRKGSLKELLSSKILDAIGYDFIIIDNGPSVDEKVLTAIDASDAFVIPLIMKMFSLQGLREIVERLEKTGVARDRIMILRNEMKSITQYKATYLAVESMYPENTLQTVIPYDDTLDGILSENGKNLILSRSKSKAGLAIIDLVVEIFGIEVLGLDRDEIMNVIANKRKEKKIENARHLNNFRIRQPNKTEDLSKTVEVTEIQEELA